MSSFETLADSFPRLSVFDSHKGSSNIFKTHKYISLYFKRKYLIINKYNQSKPILLIASRRQGTWGQETISTFGFDQLYKNSGRGPKISTTTVIYSTKLCTHLQTINEQIKSPQDARPILTVTRLQETKCDEQFVKYVQHRLSSMAGGGGGPLSVTLIYMALCHCQIQNNFVIRSKNGEVIMQSS